MVPECCKTHDHTEEGGIRNTNRTKRSVVLVTVIIQLRLSVHLYNSLNNQHGQDWVLAIQLELC